MPSLKTYDMFISHAWNYNEEYYRLIDLLDGANNFYYRNYSVPEHDPVIEPNSDVGKRALSAALDRQIRPVNCVLVIAGMYAAYKYWIQKEIDLAQIYDKPIIGVIPRGLQRTPVDVQNASIEMVGWNTNSIVDAIRRHSL